MDSIISKNYSKITKFEVSRETCNELESLISMIAMELAMNFTDIFLEGALVLSFSSLIPVLVVGFIVPWPYNYWRLVKYNKNCCG